MTIWVVAYWSMGLMLLAMVCTLWWKMNAMECPFGQNDAMAFRATVKLQIRATFIGQYVDQQNHGLFHLVYAATRGWQHANHYLILRPGNARIIQNTVMEWCISLKRGGLGKRSVGLITGGKKSRWAAYSIWVPTLIFYPLVIIFNINSNNT